MLGGDCLLVERHSGEQKDSDDLAMARGRGVWVKRLIDRVEGIVRSSNEDAASGCQGSVSGDQEILFQLHVVDLTEQRRKRHVVERCVDLLHETSCLVCLADDKVVKEEMSPTLRTVC